MGRLRSALVNDHAADLAAEYGRELLPRWNAMALEMFRAYQEAARITTRFRAFRAEVMQAGIRTEILKSPNVSAPLQLGSEDDAYSQITSWRKILESWGLL